MRKIRSEWIGLEMVFSAAAQKKSGQIEATVKGKREEYNVSIIFRQK